MFILYYFQMIAVISATHMQWITLLFLFVSFGEITSFNVNVEPIHLMML